ncbi:MAG: hypothetical protein LBP22_12195 [Deltaproteobacteria bacterium]|jgi:hypothetical protein|nr:hypothetical protein [Deltaproteobacteria bacterium]
MSALKGLPIGQAKFESIRRKNFVYADKTELLTRLSIVSYSISCPGPGGSANPYW